MMEYFLVEYGLFICEGVVLMCLVEVMLCVFDCQIIDVLIEDKIVFLDWGRYLGEVIFSMVNVLIWVLMLMGKVLDDDQFGMLCKMICCLGELVICLVVGCVMKEMGCQFVLGQIIDVVLDCVWICEKQGFIYSYDMLGEVVMISVDVVCYDWVYVDVIVLIVKVCDKGSVEVNLGILIKFLVLYFCYEVVQEDCVMCELVLVVLKLV